MTRADGALLRLSQGSFELSIARRGAVNRVLAMDLEGFFQEVYLLFFKADRDAVHSLSPRHTVVDLAVTAPGRGRAAAARAEAGFLRAALRLIRERRVRALSANDPYLSGFNALLLSRLSGIPYVIEVVSDYDLSHRAAGIRTMPYLPSRRAEKLVERRVLRSASAVYAWNRHYLDYARRNGAREDRCCLVRGITDPFFYTASPGRRLEEYVGASGRRVLLSVGRLSGEKYPLDLLECLEHVREGGEPAMLVLAGEGPLRPELERRARERGLSEHLVLLGHRGSQEVVDLMSGADVLLAAHMGYALIEAALSGTPIVAYEHEWHPELIRHEETGLLAPYRNPAAMARQVLRLLRDRELSRRLGGAARESALADHHPDRAREEERALYARLLGGRRVPAPRVRPARGPVPGPGRREA